ncbi:MAG TPA: nitroreductase family protein [Candidatus Edwardsbacteria bacterium]|nr:nitroreductase family protein [Candidatus Edwardsbacteria bacterium]
MDNVRSNPAIRLLLERGSWRAFAARRIPARVMGAVLDCGAHAASGGNLQPYSVVVVQDRAVNRRLATLCRQPFVGQAPANLLFCIDARRLERWARLMDAPYTARGSFRHFWISFQDTIIAAQNICTAADALGLGSCYIGTVMEFLPTLKRMFKLPHGVLPVVLLTVGYPAKRPQPRRKLGPQIIAHFGRYRDLPDAALLKAFEGKYPGFKLEATPQRRREFEEVCRKVGGPAFARRCLARVERQGHINMAQYYFGLHYRADGMPDSNLRFMEQIGRSGFGWFKKYSHAQ